MNWLRYLKVTLSTGVLTLALAAPAWAQQPSQQQPDQQQPSQQEQQKNLKTFEGKLTKVDTEDKTLTVKNDQGKEMSFEYNDQTEVTGAENSIEGLSSGTGTEVTVSYEEGWVNNTAVKIDVHEAAQMQGQANPQPESQSSPQSSSSSQQSVEQNPTSASQQSAANRQDQSASASASQSMTGQNNNANQQQARNNQNDQGGEQTSSLPQTASPAPLVALLGFVSLGGAWFLGKLRS